MIEETKEDWSIFGWPHQWKCTNYEKNSLGIIKNEMLTPPDECPGCEYTSFE